MARVELTQAAVEDLERLIYTHSLPVDTKERVKRSLRPLEDFPYIGAPLEGRWEGFRFLLGPWRWMLIVYEYFEDEKRVVVETIQDGRSSRAGTDARRR
jgi:plasmid stabilization system protein ParE